MSDSERNATRPTGPRKINVPDDALQIMFTGSRTIKDTDIIRDLIINSVYDVLKLIQRSDHSTNAYTRPMIFAEGGAHGLDSIVAHMTTDEDALDWDATLRTYPADWKKHGRVAGMRRNQEMILDSDACIAIWDGRSRGTMHAFRTARRAGLFTQLIIPDAQFTDLDAQIENMGDEYRALIRERARRIMLEDENR